MTNKLPNGCSIISLKEMRDKRGNLVFLEGSKDIPFDVKRVFWIYGVPANETRGGHAHTTCSEVVFSAHGSFDMYVCDGKNETTVSISSPNKGIVIPAGIWCRLENFRNDTVCVVVASEAYSEEGYINNFEEYKKQLHQ